MYKKRKQESSENRRSRVNIYLSTLAVQDGLLEVVLDYHVGLLLSIPVGKTCVTDKFQKENCLFFFLFLGIICLSMPCILEI